MNWKEIILPSYEIRKSKAQKEAFISMLRGHFGDRLTVEESGSLVKSRNIVLGSPDTAKIVFTAHYDTCARMPVPNFITPKNFLVYLLYQLVLTAVILAPPFLLSALTAHLSSSLPDLAGLLLTELALILPAAAELWLIMAGPANPHTVNDNTSGVIAVLTLADLLRDRDDCAFVLFDNEEVGLLGSAAFAKAHPEVKKSTMLVNFDCVSDGENLLLSFTKAGEDSGVYRYVKEHAEEICAAHGRTPVLTSSKTTFYPSDQAAFTKTAAIAALKKAPVIGLYMDRIHTPKDTVYMEENIAALTELFSKAANYGG
ncbi:MAG: M28 family peptidase [Clostridia bacterium]|nr:M28 family peptidase [Clostridia bacterium]